MSESLGEAQRRARERQAGVWCVRDEEARNVTLTEWATVTEWEWAECEAE